MTKTAKPEVGGTAVPTSDPQAVIPGNPAPADFVSDIQVLMAYHYAAQDNLDVVEILAAWSKLARQRVLSAIHRVRQKGLLTGADPKALRISPRGFQLIQHFVATIRAVERQAREEAGIEGSPTQDTQSGDLPTESPAGDPDEAEQANHVGPIPTNQ